MASNLRTNEKWETQFKFAKDLFKLSENYIGNNYYLEQFSISMRNPIVFDNQTKETNLLLDYKIPNPDGLEETKDHLLGISNMVLYMIKSKSYNTWNTVEDFKRTLQALQVSVVCPKSLNDGGFKTWIFDYDNIDICIQWNEKLKAHGIKYLLNDKGEEKLVDTIWCDWFFNYKKYLI